MNGLFPEDSAERKTYPVYSGLLRYFPSALAAVANHSHNGNEKHNPGQDLHHDRAKSGDEADALVRHLMEGDLVGMAWRALAMLQKHCEANGAPIAPAARNARTNDPASMRAEKIAYDMAYDRPSAEGLEARVIKQHRRVATPEEQASVRPEWFCTNVEGREFWHKQHPMAAEALRVEDRL